MKPRTAVRKVSARQLAKHPELLCGNTTIARTPTAKSQPRKTKPRASNPKRKATRFEHDYHSVERVGFVKSLPCAMASLGYSAACSPGTENAHTGKRPGAGLKAQYSTIAPLCHWHHHLYDTRQGILQYRGLRESIASVAAATELLWRAHVGAVAS